MRNNHSMYQFVAQIIDEMFTNVSAQLPGIESPAKPATYFRNKYPDQKDGHEIESMSKLKKYLSPDE